MAKRKIRIKDKNDEMPDWLFDFLTVGTRPDNTGMKNFKQKPGTWHTFLWACGKTLNTTIPPLDEVWEHYKKEVLQKWSGGKTYAERLLEKS